MGGVRLGFEALEFGDEPHYPKDELGIVNSENEVGFGPFGDDVNTTGWRSVWMGWIGTSSQHIGMCL